MTTSGVTAELAAQAAAERLVLVVEDEAAIRNTVADMLQDHGFRVLLADNGADALTQLETVRPDVVVLDLLMPVMHGWGFMESYVEKTGGEPIPIVVLSVNPVLPRSFTRLGVREVVSKPFEIDTLIEAIEKAAVSVPS